MSHDWELVNHNGNPGLSSAGNGRGGADYFQQWKTKEDVLRKELAEMGDFLGHYTDTC